jgi:hypothetical protein
MAWAADLKLENQALTAALLAQMKHNVQREERARLTFGRPDTSTKVDDVLWEEPGLRHVVRDYFDRLLRGGLPGEQGAAARRDLQDFFSPGSPALARARWLAKGRLPRDPDKVLPEDFSFSTLAMIHDLRLSTDGRHAVAAVPPGGQPDPLECTDEPANGCEADDPVVALELRAEIEPGRRFREPLPRHASH